MNGKQWKTWLKVCLIPLVLVGVTRGCLLTTCIIPHAGMENSLYEGEGILVSKWSYGFRMPFPSFFGYHRLLRKPIRQGDIILFNSPLPENTAFEDNPLYISRCIGIPGDTLWLNAELIEVHDRWDTKHVKALYAYPMQYETEMRQLLQRFGWDDNQLAGYTPDSNYIRSFSPEERGRLLHAIQNRWPLKPLNQYTQAVLPYVIPQKGKAIRVEKWNLPMLSNALRLHEHRHVTVKGDSLWVDGRWARQVVFSQNYYWMASNDPMSLNDSRLFGLVPERHLIGKAWKVWLPVHLNRLFASIQ